MKITSFQIEPNYDHDDQGVKQMKTLKRLKNILGGEEKKEEEKTETPQGETVKTRSYKQTPTDK